MKKTILSIFGICALVLTQAQQTSDVITTGAGNTLDVFYSLQNGAVSSVSNENWDIAFNTNMMAADIRINGGKGVELYAYPHGDISDFSSVDTAGIASWTQLFNSSETWDIGAFNANATGATFDYGWGAYNMSSHSVVGDSLFVIKTLAGDYKKIWIESLIGGNYNFKFANLDNTGLTIKSVTLSTYGTKNYFYYSIDNDLVIDREPANTTWDFVATKYNAPHTQLGHFPSTGILTNRGVKTREARNIDVTVASWPNFVEEEKIDVIGTDWKIYDMTTHTYGIQDELSYFVTDKSGNIWQIIFTAYTSSTGEIEFTKEMISAVSIDENNAINLGLYPNPTSSQVTFLYDNLSEDMATVTVYDLQGKIVYSTIFNGEGFNQQTVDVSFLNAGIYSVTIQSESRVGTQKLVIQ